MSLTKKNQLKFHFVTAVWGNEYTDLFLKVCLPNQLTDGNLFAFRDDARSAYKIYTSERNAEKIISSKYYKELQNVIPTFLYTVEELFQPHSKRHTEEDHSRIIPSMTKCHRMAIAKANAEDAAIVFLAPDHVYSDGTFAAIRRIAQAGKRVVAIPGVRVVQETFTPEFLRLFKNNNGHAPVSSRELARLGLSHIHPLTKQYYIDSNYFEKHPWHLYWRVGDNGLLGRCSHFHPLMVYPRNKNALPAQANDQDFYSMAVPDIKDFHIVTDSDEILCFDLTMGEKLNSRIKPRTFKELVFIASLLPNLKPMQLKFYRFKIKIHADDFSEEWAKVEKASDELINRMLATAHLFKSRSYPKPLKPMNNVKSVAVFGTGEGCRHTLNFIKDCGWRASYLVDNNSAKWGTNAFGLPVKNPIDLKKRDVDLIIVASKHGKNSIFPQLDSMGFSCGLDYIYYLDHIWIGATENAYIYKRLRMTPRIAPEDRVFLKMECEQWSYSKRGLLKDIDHQRAIVQASLNPGEHIPINHSFIIATDGAPTRKFTAGARLDAVEYDPDGPDSARLFVFKLDGEHEWLKETIDMLFPQR